MSVLISRFLLTTLIVSLSACGGSGSVSSPEPRKTPAPVATNDFLDLVKEASCAEMKNRLILIDQKYVLWDKSGNCADASYAQNLYESSPKNLICAHMDSIAGPRSSCTDPALENLFKTIIQNLDKSDFGLGGAHQVQTIAIPAAKTRNLPIKTLTANFYRGTPPDYALIKETSAWNLFWNYANIKPSAALQTPDFNKQMVLVKFHKTPNDCSITRILKVESDGQTLTAHFFDEERVAITRCDPETTLSSTPIHMIEIPKSDLPLALNNVSTRQLNVKTIASGNYSQVQIERNIVIRDQNSWNKLWQEHQADTTPPIQVDFTKRMIIAVFLGAQASGCAGVQDLRIWRHNGKLMVTHYDLAPTTNSVCTASITSPYYFAEIDHSTEVVEFNHVVTPVQ